MSGETREERNARLLEELDLIAERIDEIQRELRGEGLARTPEERRRGFRVVGGGAVGVAAFASVPRAWVLEHSRRVVAYATAATGGAVIAAAVFAHPAHAPYTSPQQMLPTATTASSSAAPAARPAATPTSKPRGRRVPPLPPITVSTRRRTPTPAPQADGAGLGPDLPLPIPEPSVSMLPLRTLSPPLVPSPSPSRTCLVLPALTPPSPILTACL